jgi:hypothetical protein
MLPSPGNPDDGDNGDDGEKDAPVDEEVGQPPSSSWSKRVSGGLQSIFG